MRRRTARRLSPRTSEPGRAPARCLLIADFSVAGLAPSANACNFGCWGIPRFAGGTDGLRRCRPGAPHWLQGLSSGRLASRTRQRRSTLDIERRTRAHPGRTVDLRSIPRAVVWPVVGHLRIPPDEDQYITRLRSRARPMQLLAPRGRLERAMVPFSVPPFSTTGTCCRSARSWRQITWRPTKGLRRSRCRPPTTCLRSWRKSTPERMRSTHPAGSGD